MGCEGGSLDRVWDVVQGGGRRSQGEGQSTRRAGTPCRMTGKKEIKVEGSKVTDRTWPGHNLVGNNEPLLPSKHCWV